MSKLTNRPFWPRESGNNVTKWITDYLRQLDIEWFQLTNYVNKHYHTDSIFLPDSITVVAGTPAGGVALSQIQTPLDGNVYQVTEVAATPGFNIEITFSEVLYFSNITCRVRYDGSATHFVAMEVYDYIAAAYQQIGLLSHTSSYYNWFNWRIKPNTNYITTGGVAKIRLYHYTAGNNSHNIYIDYAALNQNSYDAT